MQYISDMTDHDRQVIRAMQILAVWRALNRLEMFDTEQHAAVGEVMSTEEQEPGVCQEAHAYRRPDGRWEKRNAP